MQIDYIDNLKIVKNVYISSEVTSDVDDLVKTNTLTLDETHVHDSLIESSTSILDDIDVQRMILMTLGMY